MELFRSWISGRSGRGAGAALKPLPDVRAHFEPLEDRRLLAIDFFDQTLAGVVEAFHVGTDNTRPVDYGDFYLADGQQVSLKRAVDEVVIGLDDASAAAGILQQWQDAAGIAGSLLSVVSLDSDTVTLQLAGGAAADFEATLASLAGLPGVTWAGPVFVDAASGLKQIATDEIIVALQAGVAADAFFSGDTFSSYHPLAGTDDQFVARLAAGGGLTTLRVASELESDPRVVWASPDFYSEAVKLTDRPLLQPTVAPEQHGPEGRHAGRRH